MIDSGLALARVAQVGGSEEMLRPLMQLGAKVDATGASLSLSLSHSVCLSLSLSLPPSLSLSLSRC